MTRAARIASSLYRRRHRLPRIVHVEWRLTDIASLEVRVPLGQWYPVPGSV